MAEAVKAQRQAIGPENPGRKLESAASELTSASLDCYRGLRDAAGEATFFEIYGNLFAFYLDDEKGIETAAQRADDPVTFPSSRRRSHRSTKAATRRRSPVSPSCWRTRTSLFPFRGCSSHTS
jgi:hypothetical protein